jgi:hypothetical protein
LLPVDIRKDPLSLLQGMQQFVEHRIQLIDIKGIDEFVAKAGGRKRYDHNRAGKEHYADIVEATRNVLQLIIGGVITV